MSKWGDEGGESLPSAAHDHSSLLRTPGSQPQLWGSRPTSLSLCGPTSEMSYSFGSRVPGWPGKRQGRGKADGQPCGSRVLADEGPWGICPHCAQGSALPDTRTLTLILLGLNGRVGALGKHLLESETCGVGETPVSIILTPGTISPLAHCWALRARDVVASLTHSQASTDLKFRDITGY